MGIHTLDIHMNRNMTDADIYYCSQITDAGLEYNKYGIECLNGVTTINIYYCQNIIYRGLEHLRGV